MKGKGRTVKKIITTLLISALTGFSLSPGLRADINSPTRKEYVYLGRYFVQVGEPEKAIKNYEDLIRKHPCTPEAERAWISLGDIYLYLLTKKRAEIAAVNAGNEKTGVGNKIRGLQVEEITLRRKAVSSYQTAVDKFPDSAGLALVRIGKVYAFQSLEQEDRGRAIFRRVMNGFPEEAGRAGLFLGDSYSSQQKFEEAKNAYHQAGFSFPEVAASAQVLISRLDRQLEDPSTAVNDLSPVLNVSGIDGLFTEYRYKGSIMQEAIELTAESMIAEKNPDLAIEHLKGIIRRYPASNTSCKTQLFLAEIYRRQGEMDQAREELNRLISGYPKSLYAARASLRKAEIVTDEEAVDIYESLRKRFPGSGYWMTASRLLAGRYLKMAEKAEKEKGKKALRTRAGVVAGEIISKYPCSPQADQVREFMKANKLK